MHGQLSATQANHWVTYFRSVHFFWSHPIIMDLSDRILYRETDDGNVTHPSAGWNCSSIARNPTALRKSLAFLVWIQWKKKSSKQYYESSLMQKVTAQKGLKTKLWGPELSPDKANVLWINNHSTISAYSVNYFWGPKRRSLSERSDLGFNRWFSG